MDRHVLKPGPFKVLKPCDDFLNRSHQITFLQMFERPVPPHERLEVGSLQAQSFLMVGGLHGIQSLHMGISQSGGVTTCAAQVVMDRLYIALDQFLAAGGSDRKHIGVSSDAVQDCADHIGLIGGQRVGRPGAPRDPNLWHVRGERVNGDILKLKVLPGEADMLAGQELLEGFQVRAAHNSSCSISGAAGWIATC